MAFGGFNKSAVNSAPQAEINMVPLIDVMLVLLVIFIVTAPMLTHSVKIELPQASSQPIQTQPDKIELAINGEGTLFWNGEPMPRNELDAHLAQAALQKPTPELHLKADKTTRYETIAEVMSAAAREGVTKIGFVTEPPPALIEVAMQIDTDKNAPDDEASAMEKQASAAGPVEIDSASLLKGQHEMRINHDGSTYTLRRTRGGKLILTK